MNTQVSVHVRFQFCSNCKCADNAFFITMAIARIGNLCNRLAHRTFILNSQIFLSQQLKAYLRQEIQSVNSRSTVQLIFLRTLHLKGFSASYEFFNSFFIR
jgi:hypothetical protein